MSSQLRRVKRQPSKAWRPIRTRRPASCVGFLLERGHLAFHIEATNHRLAEARPVSRRTTWRSDGSRWPAR